MINDKAAATNVANQLIGTCSTLPQMLEQLDLSDELQNQDAFCTELDRVAFCCTECEWWASIDECNDDLDTDGQVCDECFKWPCYVG